MKTCRFVIVSALVFAIGGFVLMPEVWGPGRQFLSAVLPSLVVVDTNQDRQISAISPLRENPLLTEAAQLKADDMAKRGYFSHAGPDGEAPWSWLDKVGYNYVYAGENLAINFYDSNDVNQAWMNSPEHRENILDKKFTDIGIGTAEGLFDGRATIFVVQFFGSTEESLTARSTQKLSSLNKNSHLLASVSNLTLGLTSLVRHWTMVVLPRFGYEPAVGKII